MINSAKNPHILAYNILNIIWGCCTLLMIALTLYIMSAKDTLQTHILFASTANKINNNVSALLNKLLLPLSMLNIDNYNNQKYCASKLRPQLDTILFNTPQISSIILYNTESHSTCSTLDINLPPMSIVNKRILSGPVKLDTKNRTAFFLQQPIGNNQVQVYFLQDILIRAIAASENFMQRIILYNKQENKIQLNIRHAANGQWHNDTAVFNDVDPRAFLDLKLTQLTTNLIDLDNEQIIFFGNFNVLNYKFLLHALIAAGLIFLSSCIMYGFLRYFINRYFSIHNIIKRGIKNHLFFPVFQPIYDVHKNQCCGAEVLLRWQSRNDSSMVPEFFIAQIEQSGLIVPITLYLIKQAFHDCYKILQYNPEFYLSINLSSAHFIDPTFFDGFFNLCTQYAFKPKNIMFELTERELISHQDLMLVKRLQQLHEHGYALAIDDFGTGHANISYLQYFPLTAIKIAHLFISAINTSTITDTLNQAIIALAKKLNLQLIAEGVETLEQVLYLEQHGIYTMQGWYFAKAMSSEELEQFITSTLPIGKKK